jgi:hypothetical protein
MYTSIRHRHSNGSAASGFEARASAQPNQSILFQVTVPAITADSALMIDLSHLSRAEREQDVEFIVQGALTNIKRGPHCLTVDCASDSLISSPAGTVIGTIEIKTVECTLISTIVTGDKVKFDFPIR